MSGVGVDEPKVLAVEGWCTDPCGATTFWEIGRLLAWSLEYYV